MEFDRHTIAKYYYQEKRIPIKRNKESYLYPYLDEIKGIKKVISIRIWMRSNKKQSFVNVVRRLCSSIFKINMGSKNSNATTHLPTLPGNMISAFLITLKTKITL